jgi:sugar O-acyltransferase (sialic acid O-acetyltransferase NeuD family)
MADGNRDMTSEAGGVVIAGAGGLGREAASLLAALDAQTGPAVMGFLDDDPALAGHTVIGLPVLGSIETIHEMPDCRLVLALASPADRDIRRRVAARVDLPPDRYVSLIHPSVWVGADVEIGYGSIVFPGAVFTQGIRLGRHTVMMPNVVLTHDDVIGDCVTFGAGAQLAGRVRVGDCAYIGSGAVLREGTSVGAGAMLGMGSVLLEDVPAGETWVGVPARPLRPLR